jgi:lysophospholipase L1-like esterase
MWSEVPGVQVVAWRMLNRLSSESWAADALDMLYLEDGIHPTAEGHRHVAENVWRVLAPVL